MLSKPVSISCLSARPNPLLSELKTGIHTLTISHIFLYLCTLVSLRNPLHVVQNAAACLFTWTSSRAYIPPGHVWEIVINIHCLWFYLMDLSTVQNQSKASRSTNQYLFHVPRSRQYGGVLGPPQKKEKFYDIKAVHLVVHLK